MSGVAWIGTQVMNKFCSSFCRCASSRFTTQAADRSLLLLQSISQRRATALIPSLSSAAFSACQSVYLQIICINATNRMTLRTAMCLVMKMREHVKM